MNRADELFERITTQGMTAIEGFVVDRQAEELFLDFKRSSNDGQDARLSSNDRKNLAKCIAGFGNSEGGVVVWGVDCSTDHDGADVAKAIVPIENPKRFASLIQGAISGCTIPPHSGVRVGVVELDNGNGIVVVLVPKSDATPHQSVVTKHYYIRAGSDFVPTPHDVLAGMFGRRPQPHVFHHFLLAVPSLDGGALKISFGIAIHNKGPGIAADIFSIVRAQSLPGPECQVAFDTPDRTNWTGSFEFGRQLSLISAPGFRLPPGANVQPTIVNLRLRPPFDGELRISGSVGAGESRHYDLVIACPADVVESQYNAFIGMVKEGGHSRDEMQRIAGVILGEPEA